MTYKTVIQTNNVDDDIASYVMGWVSAVGMLQRKDSTEEKYWFKHGSGGGEVAKSFWHPSTEMAHAWEALEYFIKSHKRNLDIGIWYKKNQWWCRIMDSKRAVMEAMPTAQQAICKVLMKWEKGRI